MLASCTHAAGTLANVNPLIETLPFLRSYMSPVSRSGRWLASARKRLKLSQQELSTVLNISRTMLGQYERDQYPIPVPVILAVRYLLDNKHNILAALQIEPEDMEDLLK